MATLWVRLLACCLLWTTVKANSTLPVPDMTYWVSFAKAVRPGFPLAVSVYAGQATGPVTLWLELMDYYGNVLQAEQEFHLYASNEIQTVEYEVSSSLARNWRMYLRARASGGLTFDSAERVNWDYKRLSVFIQTDKAVYKPGQTVRFRTLAMLPDIRVIHKPVDVVITDPNRNKIAQWTQVQDDDNTGVFQGEMVTSHYPPLGMWTIQATVDGVSHRQYFKVEEYELPRFEISVTFPDYAVTDDETVTGKVSAKYTFGAPVKGICTVKAFLFFWRDSDIHLKKEVTLDSKGEADVEFAVEDLRVMAFKTYNDSYSYYSLETFSLNYKRIQFNASVTDELTDDVMTADTSLRFYEDRIRLRFLPISPYAYKPGLPYIAYVQATTPDGKPLENAENLAVEMNVTYNRYATPSDGLTTPSYSTYYYYNYKPQITEQLFTKTVLLDSNAVGELIIHGVPSTAVSIYVWAKIGEYSTRKYITMYYSPAETYVEVKLLTDAKKVGQTVRIEAKSNVEFGTFTYLVYAKKQLVMRKVEYKQKSTKHVFRLPLTSAMAPVADVLVFFEADEGELVADTLVIGIEKVFENQVNLKFKEAEVKPGASVKLQIAANPYTTVFLLGVDKSVKLLGTGNDITRERIMMELMLYGRHIHYVWNGQYHYYDYSSTAAQVLSGIGAGIITDGFVPGKYNDVPQPFKTTLPPTTTTPESTTTMAPTTTTAPATTTAPVLMGAPPMLVSAAKKPSVAQALKAPAPSPSKSTPQSSSSFSSSKSQSNSPAERLRKFFPETWLFDTVDLQQKGKFTLKKKAPDTITTWVVNAFAVHPLMGLSVAQSPVELLTIKRLFVTLDLPYSAVRGEDVCFNALVFNRYSVPLKVNIILAKNGTAFDNILIKRNKKGCHVQISKPKRIRRELVVSSGTAVSTTFCIRPKVLGDMPVRVLLKAKKPGDGLVRTIRIKPEGVERTQNYPVLIELTHPAGSFAHTVGIDLPGGIVPGSLRYSVSAIGDVMGPAVDNVADLLRMPYGCGEQNMIHFAPNIYIIAYLRKTERLTPTILTKSRSYMLAGYQRQLNYQRKDGSFSAFGERDSSGSVWLTAFVTKCFIQAMALGNDVIIIDQNVITKALSWMVRYQHDNGSFYEPGKVFHRALQGGSAEGVALTAYICITLTEANNSLTDDVPETSMAALQSSLSLAVKFLEDQLNNVQDTYTVCIVAYALTLAGSNKAQLARNKMDQMDTVAGLFQYWEGPVETKTKVYSWYRKTDALNIEMTAYALLTIMHKGPVSEGIRAFRWLVAQRGPNGGFISTQDTVVGLEALASMSALSFKDNGSPVSVNVNWNSGGPQTAGLTIDKDSVMLLQKVSLPVKSDDYPGQVTVTAASSVAANERVFVLAGVSGASWHFNVSYIKVTVDYNVKSATIDQVFYAEVELMNVTPRSFTLKACVQRISNSTSPQSMVLVDVGLPSGYDVIKRWRYYENVYRFDYPEGRVVLYYYSLGKEPDCFHLHMRMNKGMVANSKPAYVKVYDYYNPDDEYTTYYSPHEYNACDILDYKFVSSK